MNGPLRPDVNCRHFPVRPDLARLRHEADEVGAEALAAEYGHPSWARLERACEVIDAIWRDDVDGLRALVRAEPALLVENARGVPGNWGPPLSYAANLGRLALLRMLHDEGARDHDHAFGRAVLQGELDAAQLLLDLGATPAPDEVMGPAETQSGEGMAFLLERGAPLQDSAGDPLAPVALVLETYCRNPAGKHRCLELFAAHGVELPDTAPMALHRGRRDLLEAHLARDPDLFERTFDHAELYPPTLGCHADETLALHGTPLAGGTLLHLAVDDDQLDLARWMLDRGAPVDALAAVDAEGFGGHTALFGCVVSQPYRVGLRTDDAFARLLLGAGACPGRRASLRKRLRFVEDESWHHYEDVTPWAWGERFHGREWVNPAAHALVRLR